MTNEKITEEILYKSHSLGIRTEVWELAQKFREDDSSLDTHNSIHKAFHELTK